MKQLREHIKKQIKFLMEEKYPAPPEITDVLKNTLKLKPLIRYVNALKAVNDLDKSYEVFLHNGHTFLISYLGNEEGNFKATISNKEYDLLDIRQLPLALDALDTLLKAPVQPSAPGEEGEGGEESEMEEPAAEEPAAEEPEEPAA